MHNNLQRTDDWKLQRRGMITASGVVNLLVNSRDKKGFGKTAIDYLDEIVSHRPIIQSDERYLCWDEECNKSTAAMQHGVEWESTAIDRYIEQTGNEVTDSGFVQLQGFEGYVGCSPDGLVGADGLIEVKCPYTTKQHIRYMMMKEGKDLLEVYPTYYAQIQLQLLATKRNWCDFVSYNPYIDMPNDIAIRRVEADEAYQLVLWAAIGMGVEYIKEKEKVLEELTLLNSNF